MRFKEPCRFLAIDEDPSMSANYGNVMVKWERRKRNGGFEIEMSCEQNSYQLKHGFSSIQVLVLIQHVGLYMRTIDVKYTSPLMSNTICTIEQSAYV